jgi:hypothetical protein
MGRSKGQSTPLSFLALFLIIQLSANINHAAEAQVSPLTEHGQPNLQGVWFYGSGTPFDRPVELGEKKTYSEAEAMVVRQSLIDGDMAKLSDRDPNRAAPIAGARIAQEADHEMAISRINLVQIDGEYRTSQIVSPVDGRWPYRQGALDFFERLRSEGHGAFDGPETRPASERCVGPNAGPAAPMVGWFYNANMQIIQTEDYVIISGELNHDARIIPLNREQAAYDYPQWMGNSWGYWDGDTLVVETTDFRAEQSWFAFRMSGQLAATERFRLNSPNEIYYRLTLTDPEMLTEPLVLERNIVRRSPGETIYEYACHEGNYSLSSILAGARRQESDSERGR